MKTYEKVLNEIERCQVVVNSITQIHFNRWGHKFVVHLPDGNQVTFTLDQITKYVKNVLCVDFAESAKSMEYVFIKNLHSRLTSIHERIITMQEDEKISEEKYLSLKSCFTKLIFKIQRLFRNIYYNRKNCLLQVKDFLDKFQVFLPLMGQLKLNELQNTRSLKIMDLRLNSIKQKEISAEKKYSDLIVSVNSDLGNPDPQKLSAEILLLKEKINLLKTSQMNSFEDPENMEILEQQISEVRMTLSYYEIIEKKNANANTNANTPPEKDKKKEFEADKRSLNESIAAIDKEIMDLLQAAPELNQYKQELTTLEKGLKKIIKI